MRRAGFTTNRPRTITKRGLAHESLEQRRLLVSNWQNPYTPYDVDFNGIVSPADVLAVFNKLNIEGSGPLPDTGSSPPPSFYDTNGDGILSPVDALGPINALNGDNVPPTITVNLARDTAPLGEPNNDLRTFDPEIVGVVRDRTGSLQVAITLDEGPVEIVAIERTGSFTYLPELPADGTADGVHTIRLRAADGRGNEQETEFTFVLDTTGPANLSWELSAGSDTGTAGDGVTEASRVAIVGLTEAGAVVQIFPEGVATIADSQGGFRLNAIPLHPGDNWLRVEASDTAGNIRIHSALISRLAPPAAMLLSEQGSLIAEASELVELGQESGSRMLRFEIEAGFDTTDTSAILTDRLLVYLVDPDDSSRTLLDRGQQGTALFALDERGAEYLPGVVRFDGKAVTIDVTSLGQLAAGRLLFQLLNADGDEGSQILIQNIESVTSPLEIFVPDLRLQGEPAATSGGLDTSVLQVADRLDLQFRNLRFDTSSGRLAADLHLRNAGAPVGRTAVVLFPGLPAGVELVESSGVDANGTPYLNLASAIPSGGLDYNAASQPVLLEISNPALVQFPLAALVLTGGPNQAPQLDSFPPVTVMPGDTRRLAVTANDPDGDLLTYMLVPGVTGLPGMSIDEQGTIRIAPAPGDVGEYEVAVVVSDGMASAQQVITVAVVADPVTTSRVTGRVLGIDLAPLADIPIELDGVWAQTAADGTFVLELANQPISDPTLIVHGQQYPGPAIYPFIAEKLELLFPAGFFAGVNNVLERPIFLPILDVANGATIDPADDTLVEQEIAPGETAAVLVKAGTLVDQQGQPFAGVLSITEVPRDLTPAALPANLVPDTVVTIQPGEMVFTEPAPLTLPNRSRLAAGVKLELWSINPETGDFDHVGTGEVTADATAVETIAGGVRNSSWHFFALQAGVPDFASFDLNLEQGCLTCENNGETSVPAASDVLLHSGNLVEGHSLASYQSLGMARSLTLNYDSGRVAQDRSFFFRYPELGSDETSVNIVTGGADEILTRVEGRLEILSGGRILTTRSFHDTIDVATQTSGANLAVRPVGIGRPYGTSVRVPLAELATGQYEARLTVGVFTYVDGVRASGSSSVSSWDFIHVNARTSMVGTGWGIAGMQELVPTDRGLLLVDGNGTELQFTATPSGFESPAGDFSTLEQLPDGTYRRTMTDQTVYDFNSLHRLEAVRDRNGNTTIFEYDLVGNPLRIVDPVGLETSFAYSGRMISAIEDPVGRITRFEHDAAGNLTVITDPDQTRRQFTYDSASRMTGEVDKRGHTERVEYDAAGRVAQVIRRDGSTMQFRVAQTRPDLPRPVAATIDANGNVTSYILDRAGQTVSSRDQLGSLGSLARNELNQVVETVNPRGRATRLTYDERGLVTRIDELSPADFQTTSTLFPGQILPTSRTTTSVTAVLAGDVNGDGQTDMIRIDRVSGTTQARILILEAMGGGDFRESQEVFVPNTTVRQASLAQVNDDPFPDIVLSTSSHEIVVLLNDGSGGFPIRRNVALGSEILHLTTGDVNGDQFTDILTAHRNGELRVLAGNGDGTFATPSVHAFDAFHGLKVEDVNRDGRADLVGISSATPRVVAVRLGSEQGGFSQPIELSVSGLRSERIAMGDLNGDSLPDVVLHGFNSGIGSYEIRSLLNDGEGGFTPRATVATTGVSSVLQLADVTGDGRLDVVSLLLGATVHPGDGTGQFGEAMFSAAAISGPSTIADITGEGIPDVAYAVTAGTVIYRGNGQGVFESSLEVARNASDFAIADFDRNGHLDMVSTHGTTSLTVTRTTAAGEVLARSNVGGFSFVPTQPAAADLNSDGFADIVVIERANVVVLWNDGAGQFSASNMSVFGTAASMLRELEVVDINGDGELDIVALAQLAFGGQLLVFLGDGEGLLQLQAPVTVEPSGVSLAVGDLNNDGQLDIAVGQGLGFVTVFFGDGGGGFESQTTIDVKTSTAASEAILTVGDLGDDGLLDVAVIQNGMLTILTPDGEGSFEVWPPLPVPQTQPGGVAIGDVDGDGQNEIVLAAGGLSVLWLDSNFTLQQRQDFAALTGSGQVRLLDFLGTGAVDVLTGGHVYQSRLGGGTQYQRAFEYDPVFGQPIVVTDALGRRTLYDIDSANGDILSVTQVMGELDATSGEVDDIVVSFTYTVHGLVDTRVDPLGRVTQYQYDALGRMIRTILAAGSEHEAVVSYEYDGAGNLTATIDENGSRTSFTYDALNRLTHIVAADPDGDGPLTSPVSTFEYDAGGNMIRTVDAQGSTARNTYDAMDRPRSIRDELGNVSRYHYDLQGNQVEWVDPSGHLSRAEYDPRNRRVRVIDPLGAVTRANFDAANNLTSVIDPLGNVTRYEFDLHDRLVKRTDPLGNSTMYAYDAVDNLIASIDRLGRGIQFQYDEVDRLVAETWTNPDDSLANEIHYRYDKTGAVTSIDDYFSRLAYAYDSRGRVWTVDNDGTPAVPGVVLEYAYDNAGNIVSVTDTIDGAVGATTNYAYDGLHRPTQITQTGPEVDGIRVDFAYNGLGQYSSIARYSELIGQQPAIWTDYRYDTLHRLLELRHSSSAGELAFHEYSYDASGRIVSTVDNDGLAVYEHDERGQLTVAERHEDDPRGDELYAYDANGNRLASRTHGEMYLTGPANRLLSDGRYDYQYDDEGNTVGRSEIATGEQREFAWDHRGRLIRITDFASSGAPSQEVRFVYDALDRRISQVVDVMPEVPHDELVTHFIYDREDVLLDVLLDPRSGNPSTAVVVRYLHGLGLDEVLWSSVDTESPQWLLTDQLGTIRNVAGSDGQTAVPIHYDAYGNPLNLDELSQPPRYLFTGREWDASVELYYFRARTYDPATGTFLSEDLLPVTIEPNPYRYVGNAPLMFVDPLGLERHNPRSVACCRQLPAPENHEIVVKNTPLRHQPNYLANQVNRNGGTFRLSELDSPDFGLPRGTQVRVIGRCPSWLQVETAGGLRGFIPESAISKPPKHTLDSSAVNGVIIPGMVYLNYVDDQHGGEWITVITRFGVFTLTISKSTHITLAGRG